MLRKLALTVALAGSTLVLGCSTSEPQAQLQTTLPAGFGFHYVDEGAAAKLAYGEADSDNVGLMLLCEKGSRTVEVSDVVRSSAAPTLILASGGQRSEIKVAVQPGPAAAVAVGQASSGAPALAGFRRTGLMEVSYAGLRYTMAAKPQERASVEQFFDACD